MARCIGSRGKDVSKYNTFSLNRNETYFAFIQRQIIQYNFSLKEFNIFLNVRHAMILVNCPIWRTNSFKYIYL